ncbi:MAG: MotA/TolQ/ExbB proton channel family protein [Bacteroidetes bacterium]|nr:MotA/TolQ/ExbB proton channel family protein [Bacteroidota bacterium]MDA1126976.1 MotA/TolQ/ExbB proton channel family protein [Bacteroidota bacterium]
MKFSIGSMIGTVVSLTLIIFGVIETIKVTEFTEGIGNQFFNIPSLLIVIGGVLMASYITFQARYVNKALAGVRFFFSQAGANKKSLQKDFESIVEWNDEIRKDRVNALDRLEEERGGYLEGYLFSLLSTNYSSDDIRQFGTNHIQEAFFRQMVVVDVLRAMGGAAPAFGMFGTLFGLIDMLGNLGGDPSAMGPGLAAALMTTLYGIVLSRFIFYPVAEKIKNSASINRFRETFMLEGIILINEKKTAFFVQDKLSTFLQRDFKKKDGKSKGKDD